MRTIHRLICGSTLSGKTTLAHFMAQREAERIGAVPFNPMVPAEKIIVYDPVGTRTAANTWPNGTIIFKEKQNLLKYLAENKGRALVFIDEADLVFSHDQRENAWLLTKGRHFGLLVVLITQRPNMVTPSVRGQCGITYCFRLSRDDLKGVGNATAHNDIEKITLDRGDFLVLESGLSTYTRHNIFQIVKGQSKWSTT